jgi:hypothetical protein
MSEYFKNKNDGREFGPGPLDTIEWLIIQDPGDIDGVSQCVVLRAKTAYLAWEEASKYIQGFNKQSCQCFPRPKLVIVGEKI